MTERINRPRHHPNRTPEEEEALRQRLLEADREASFMYVWQAVQVRAQEEDDTVERPSLLKRLKRILRRR